MAELVREVIGSKGDRYRVVLRHEGNDARASCSCRAGELRNVCKHLVGVLAEPEPAAFVAGTAFGAAIARYARALDALRGAEGEVDAAKAAVRKLLREG